jgi:hypothetical protein
MQLRAQFTVKHNVQHYHVAHDNRGNSYCDFDRVGNGRARDQQAVAN